MSAEVLVAKKIGLNENNLLNFGLHYNGVNNNIFANQSDPYITNNTEQKLRFLAGFGARYIWNNNLQIGFSIP